MKKLVIYSEIELSITVAQAAYLAGIIDGEGFVGLSKKKDLKGVRGGYSYRPYIGVSNTCKSVIDWIAGVTKIGNVRANSPPKAGHKPSWRWEAWSQKASYVLRAVRPYMVIKTRQADLIILYTATATRHPGNPGLTVEERQFQIDTYEKLKAINKRGTL